MNTEEYNRENTDLQEGAGNTVTTKSMESENVSNEGHDNSPAIIRGKENNQDIGNDTVAQIQKQNHDQFNMITKLKKDIEYWQKKSIEATINHQSAEYDLKKFK